jgi:hypothetical protein
MTTPKVILQDDDEFEDFPVQGGIKTTNLESTTNSIEKVHQWQDTWEDDDTVIDFAVQLE